MKKYLGRVGSFFRKVLSGLKKPRSVIREIRRRVQPRKQVLTMSEERIGKFTRAVHRAYGMVLVLGNYHAFLRAKKITQGAFQITKNKVTGNYWWKTKFDERPSDEVVKDADFEKLYGEHIKELVELARMTKVGEGKSERVFLLRNEEPSFLKEIFEMKESKEELVKILTNAVYAFVRHTEEGKKHVREAGKAASALLKELKKILSREDYGNLRIYLNNFIENEEKGKKKIAREFIIVR